MAYLDVVGFLPAPAQPQPGFGQAADILEQSAFAYAVATNIVVLEVCIKQLLYCCQACNTIQSPRMHTYEILQLLCTS
jgi:hypothetical protein